jgi:hypothetical protein
MDRAHDVRPIKMLTLIDEFTKEALAIYPARRIRSNDVIDIFANVMIEHRKVSNAAPCAKLRLIRKYEERYSRYARKISEGLKI